MLICGSYLNILVLLLRFIFSVRTTSSTILNTFVGKLICSRDPLVEIMQNHCRKSVLSSYYYFKFYFQLQKMTAISFFKESLRNLKTVGTFTRSSKQLCRGAIKHVDFQKANVIIELGAGDGVITKHLLRAMRPDAKLFAFEVNEKFCARLQNINDNRLIVVKDSAENMGQYLAEHDVAQADYAVSAIPFVALPKELGKNIINTCKQYLKDGGLYIQIHYSLVMKQLYKSIFGNVDVHFVLINLPPAFVLVSQKR